MIKKTCAMQIGTSMDNMRQELVPAKRVALDKPSKRLARNEVLKFQPPDVVKSLPDRLRRKILEIWEERDPEGDCFQQQRRTRLILLNLPPSMRKSLRPKALQCSLPHFIDRLEWDLQVRVQIRIRFQTNHRRV
ncbi:hypothetical protein OSTOST_16121 [Ostertagia ostertagi]